MSEVKQKNPIFKRWWFWAIAIILVIGIISSGSDNENEDASGNVQPTQAASNEGNEATDAPDKTDEPAEPEKTEAPEEEVFKIGDSFETGELGVTILEVEEKTEFKSDNEFMDNVETEGKFIVVKAQLTNNDKEARTLSSTQFKLIDDQEREFETTTDFNLMMILGDDDLFFEKFNPGMSKTGVFVFETPSDIDSYSLKVYSGVAFAAKTSKTVKLK